jgi:hypothetical protein
MGASRGACRGEPVFGLRSIGIGSSGCAGRRQEKMLNASSAPYIEMWMSIPASFVVVPKISDPPASGSVAVWR